MQRDSFQKAWRIAKFFLAILLVFFVISKTNITQIRTLLGNLSWGWFLLHLFSFFLMTLTKAYQYHLLIGRKTSYSDVLRVVIWQNAISNFISNSAGIASYMAMLKAEQDVKLMRSGVVFLITKYGDLLAICLYLGLSAGVVWAEIQPLRWMTGILGLGMFVGLAAFLVTVLWRERFVTQVARLFTSFRLDRFALVARVMEALRSLAHEKQGVAVRMLLTGTVMSFLYMTLTMLYVYTSIRMFAISIGIWPLVYVAVLMQLVSFVPVQVLGGLGVTEVTSVYFFSFFGFEQGKMSAVMLGWRAIFYLANVMILLYLPIHAFFRRNTNRSDTRS